MLATETTAFGLIEMVLVFGLVLALAVWELVRVRRSLREDQSGRRAPGGGDGHEGQSR